MYKNKRSSSDHQPTSSQIPHTHQQLSPQPTTQPMPLPPPTDQSSPPTSQPFSNQHLPMCNQPETTQSRTIVQLPTEHPNIEQPPTSRSFTSSSPPDQPSVDHLPTSRPSASTPPTSRPYASTPPTTPSANISSRVNTESTQNPSTKESTTSTVSNNQPPLYETSLTVPPLTSVTSSSHHSTTDPVLNRTIPMQQPIVMYKSFPYVSGLTERIAKLLRNHYPQVKLATRQHNTVERFHSKVKDPKNKKDTINIIYNIPCNNCTSCYIGMTKNKLCQRISGHQSLVNKLEALLISTDNDSQIDELKNKTALMEHCITHEHRFNFSETKILDRSNNTTTLAFLEMCHIYNTPNTVNRRTDVENLNTAYAATLHTLKTRSIHNHQITSTMPTQSLQESTTMHSP